MPCSPVHRARKFSLVFGVLRSGLTHRVQDPARAGGRCLERHGARVGGQLVEFECPRESGGGRGCGKRRVYSSESSKMSLPVGVASISTSKKTLCECKHARGSGLVSGLRFRSLLQKRHSANARTHARTHAHAHTHERTHAHTHARRHTQGLGFRV